MRKFLAVTAMALTLALGLWFAIGASASSGRKPVNRPAKAQLASTVGSVDTLQTGTASTATQVSSSKSSGSTGSSKSANASDSEGENGGESESESGGDNESDTHEDPDGQDVNHECPPNCDTANGEQP